MKRRAVCAGTFDHLHEGHLSFLRQAKSLADELVVIVARDDTVRRIKGFSPTHDEALRKKRVAETGIPDLVVLGNLDANLFQILDELKPDVVAVGYDQRVSEQDILDRLPGCTVTRLSSFMPEKYKSSYFRNKDSTL
jgi:FAD synthetase